MEDESHRESAAENRVAPEPHEPTPEEIERTRKVMRDSLAARKPKGFIDSLMEWFR